MRRLPIFACFLALAAAAQPVRAPEYEVKAAFLYNFAKFVEWPPQAFARSSSPLHICILGRGPLGSSLQDIVQGKSVSGRPIATAQLQSPAQASLCHVLFISDSDSEALTQALDRTRDLPVLTVGQSANFLSFGGIINFVVEQDRVLFEINLPAAERHHLKLSSKLLAVARVVNAGEGTN